MTFAAQWNKKRGDGKTTDEFAAPYLPSSPARPVLGLSAFKASVMASDLVPSGSDGPSDLVALIARLSDVFRVGQQQIEAVKLSTYWEAGRLIHGRPVHVGETERTERNPEGWPQKGIFAEETEGNLDAAIQIYEGIVKESDANRSLVAQAQYRLGVCLGKKGKKDEAATAFRRLLGQFPAETELVGRTKARLSELGQTASPAIVRKIWADAPETEGSVSFDGQSFVCMEWGTGDLVIRDLTTGQKRRLTSNTSPEDGRAWSPVISRDGKFIAYIWSQARRTNELRVVSLEDSQPRTVVKGLVRSSLEDWSPDGNLLVTQLSERG